MQDKEPYNDKGEKHGLWEEHYQIQNIHNYNFYAR